MAQADAPPIVAGVYILEAPDLDVDHVIFQYSRAAKELWKFCNVGDVVFTARLFGEEAPAAWWERHGGRSSCRASATHGG